MRIYLPGTVATLRELARSSAVGVPPITAFAVTPGLRAWYVDDDIDELEYAAAGEAARASLRLISASAELPARRVVISAEVPEQRVDIRDDLDRGVVRVLEAVPIADIVSLHIDELEAESVIANAAASIDAADLGDEGAQELVDDAEGHELAWFAVQELELILADPALSAAVGGAAEDDGDGTDGGRTAETPSGEAPSGEGPSVEGPSGERPSE